MNLRYILWKDTANQWRWYLAAGNNRKIATSGESYWNKQDCINAINLVKGSFNAPIVEV